MKEDLSPLLFRLLARRAEADIDLGEGALLIAAGEYPDLDIARPLAELDRLGAKVASRVARTPGEPFQVLLDVLFGDIGFRGNYSDYYDPRNSFLNDVLERRIGIPITLAVVLLEVSRRAGIAAQGVPYPGHFLLRTVGPDGLRYVDPFEGRILEVDEVTALREHVAGGARAHDRCALEPASKRAILYRMLSNLRGIYTSRSDRGRLRSVLERMHQLAPSDDLRRALVAVGGAALPVRLGPPTLQ